ncbi:hypothetical protein CCAX7_41760 [Capsulimonas corticalis]|uniref:Uncharacterized protein n=1 Tax=Capsulimonas corticalis TaxID=2219043 RepID=A0A402CXX9_9BACT|nr:SpoIIE family protein phosphatase [Capsulimonas corticalis]BDI32125.1 hypothetical protein CCAX7_41760 [Capsulimonas corticalis]
MNATQSMIEHSPLAMATTEGPSHVLRSVNPAFCSLHGKQPDEMIGHPVALAISGAGVESVLVLLDRVYDGDHGGAVHRPHYTDPILGSAPSLKYHSYMAWKLPPGESNSQGLVIQVTEIAESSLATELFELATTEIRELNDDMRQVNEQLIISALEQHAAADRNRAIAEALQYSMLWEHSEKSFHDLRVAVFYEPAMDDALVGGDLFDAFRLHNGSVMLIVGDVTGKGLRAAARTVEIRFALRAFSQDYIDPGDMVRRLNEFICDFHFDADDLGNALVVLSLIVIDPVTGEVQAASAGAEPPMVLRASGAMEEVTVSGLILGIDHNAAYPTTKLLLNDGDLLMMTTDGITETRRGMDFFGSERLLQTAKNVLEEVNLMGVGTSILDAARAHGGGRFMDDVCLLLARRDRIMSNPVQLQFYDDAV